MRHRRRRQGARWGDPAVDITPWQRFHRAIAPGSRRYGLVVRWRNWGVRIIGADCPGRCGAKGKDGCCGEHCGEARTCHSRTTHGSRSVSWKHWKWGRQSCRSTRLLPTEGAGCGAQVNAQPSFSSRQITSRPSWWPFDAGAAPACRGRDQRRAQLLSEPMHQPDHRGRIAKACMARETAAA